MMIPFDFAEKKIVGYMGNYLKAVTSEHPYFASFINQCTPLECIICATKPRFMITDKYHSAPCEFTREALFSFKKTNPYWKLHTLKGKYIVVYKHFPNSQVVNGDLQNLHIVITSFSVLRGAQYGYASAPDAIPIMEAEELRPYFETLENRKQRNSMALAMINFVPDLEQMLFDPGNASCNQVVLPGKEEEEKVVEDQDDPELVEIVTNGFSEMNEAKQQILDYISIDVEERNIEAEVKKLRYQNFEESDRPSRPPKIDLVKPYIKEDEKVDPEIAKLICGEIEPEGSASSSESSEEAPLPKYPAKEITSSIQKILQDSSCDTTSQIYEHISHISMPDPSPEPEKKQRLLRDLNLNKWTLLKYALWKNLTAKESLAGVLDTFHATIKPIFDS